MVGGDAGGGGPRLSIGDGFEAGLEHATTRTQAHRTREAYAASRAQACYLVAMRLVIALLLFAGCGAGKKVDCEALATHVADVSTSAEAPAFKTEIRDKIHNSTNFSCSGGSYTAKQLECLGKTTSKDDVSRCLGLPVEAPKPAQPPPPSPAPPPVAKPTIADATAALTKLVAQVADGADIAMMHGCDEGQDRVGQLFGKLDAKASKLHRMMNDDALRADLEKVVKDRSDATLAAALGKLDAATGKCKRAVDVVTKEIAGLLKPQ
jgi:hypothetical protein